MLLAQDCPCVEPGKQCRNDTNTTLTAATEHYLREVYADNLLTKEGSAHAFSKRRTEYASTEYRPPS